jgi:hypothetical protein
VATDPDERNVTGGRRGVDLLTIGLLVFFVALLVTVAALLALPMILA